MTGAMKRDEVAELQVVIDELSAEHSLSEPVRGALAQLLDALESSSAVVIFPADSFVSTTQAADVLGVSRMTITRLVDRGDLAAEGGGVHRRIPVRELARYRSERAQRRRSALRSLAQEIDEDTPPDAVVETR